MDTKKTQNRPTVGHLINELQQHTFDVADATDLEIANNVLEGYQHEYEKQFLQKVEEGKNRYPNSDFFIEVHLIMPKILQRRVFQFIMHARKTLPVPTFDQMLYRYHHTTGEVPVVWIIPSIEHCAYLYEHKDLVPVGWQDNLKYVMHFAQGTLFSDTYKRYNQVMVEQAKI